MAASKHPAGRGSLRAALLVCALAACSPAPPSLPEADPAPAPVDEPALDAGGPDAGPVDAGPEPLPAVAVTDIRFSTGKLVPAYQRSVPVFEVDSLAALQPIAVTIVGTAGGRVELDGVTLALNAPAPLTLPRLAVDLQLHLKYRDLSGALVEQSIRTRPTDYPAYTVTATAPARGRIFASPSSWTKPKLPPYLLMLDELGEPVFYRRTPKPAADFKWHLLPDGALRYSYFSGGVTFVLDEDFAPVAQLRLFATARHPASATDLHDFLILGPNHYVLAAYVIKQVDNVPASLTLPGTRPTVVAAVLQEVKDGVVLFEWDSTDHPELYANSLEGNAYATSSSTLAADYVHFNSVQIDPADGNWVMSFRHLDAVLKVSRADGSILWTLGGKGDQFALPPAQRPSRQHFAHFQPGGELVVFDNGNANLQTRVVEFALDPGSRTVQSFFALPMGRFSWAMGSAQKLDAATYFIGWGSHLTAGTDLSEVDKATGQARFELTFTDAYNSYRALKRLTP